MLGVVVALVIGLLLLYLCHVERGQSIVPEEAHQFSPRRLTEKEVRQTFDRVSENPIDFNSHLPPKLDRRYIIVGGSGLVGGSIILHLLARGQSPDCIRNIDFRLPVRDALKVGKAARIGYESADITQEESIQAAFAKRWPASVAKLPLTVFHVAAKIIFQERYKVLYSHVSTVNIVGTANVIAAAKKADADIFIATSSGSIAFRPPEIWIPPWRSTPNRVLQIYPDPDKDNNIRGHYQYFGNYAVSKAYAEQLTLQANDRRFKTGCIRPACGIYGNEHDLTVSVYLRQKSVPSWAPHAIESFVHTDNVSLAHLLFEKALVDEPAKTSGRAYTVTDPGILLNFRDIFKILSTLCEFQWQHVPIVPLFLLSYLIEWYSLARCIIPGFRVLPEFSTMIELLQPATFSISLAHQIALNDQASLPPSKGGIGYHGVCSTLEGICMQAKNWNDDIAAATPRSNGR